MKIINMPAVGMLIIPRNGVDTAVITSIARSSSHINDGFMVSVRYSNGAVDYSYTHLSHALIRWPWDEHWLPIFDTIAPAEPDPRDTTIAELCSVLKRAEPHLTRMRDNAAYFHAHCTRTHAITDSAITEAACTVTQLNGILEDITYTLKRATP